MRVIGLTLVLATAAVLGLSPREARACTCQGPEGRVSPPDGATGVPVNAVVFIGDFQTALPAAHLTDATGAEVEFTPLELGGELMLRPNAPLAPDTTYTVTFELGFQGTFTSQFTTGSTSDDVLPEYAGLTSFMAIALPYSPDGCQNSCMSSADRLDRTITLDYPDPPADVVALVLRFYDPDIAGDPGTLITLLPRRWGDGREVDEGLCDGYHLPMFQPDHTYAAEIHAFDVAGNRATLAAPVMATVAACAEASYDDVCAPIECIDSGGGGGGGGAEAGGCSTTGGRGALPMLLLLGLLPFLRRR